MSKRKEKIRVLCVDDDAYQLEAMKLFFEPEDDMLVRFCSSPNETVDEIHRNEFDCVVTDCLMKEMNGIELVRSIRRTSNVPIIVYSMVDDDKVAEAALSAGANRFILKSLRIRDTVAEEIRSLIKRRV